MANMMWRQFHNRNANVCSRIISTQRYVGQWAKAVLLISRQAAIQCLLSYDTLDGTNPANARATLFLMFEGRAK